MKITRIIREISNGATKPYIIECDDGNQYVAKFPGNPDGTRVLINEFVCGSLAKKLKLPLPDFKIIKIDNIEEFDILKGNIELINGSIFCSKYVEKATHIPSYRFIRKVNNINDSLKILIFDVIIGNNDRNQGNLLVNLKNNSLVMIDHSHVFIGEALWDEKMLLELIGNDISIKEMNHFFLDMFMNEINKFDKIEFYEYINLVRSITIEDINEIIDDIPEDWMITKEEKNALCHFIYDRVKRVDEICEIFGIERGD